MKHFRLFLIVLIILLCAAVCACADSMTFTLLEDGSGYELTSCDQRSVTVTIPAEYDGLPVVSIAGDAFINCKFRGPDPRTGNAVSLDGRPGGVYRGKTV